ncbi:hypothetical protein L4C34_10035 [Vibrio profundum]|uniref:hypothetical protein n=1 Tax=Vibrio profundum TaxID=2910247 RepID=UPI003D09EF0E
MNEIWDKIEGFLKEHIPTVIATLNGPATEEALNLLESEVGHTIPKDFKSYLQVHNGELDSTVVCDKTSLEQGVSVFYTLVGRYTGISHRDVS